MTDCPLCGNHPEETREVEIEGLGLVTAVLCPIIPLNRVYIGAFPDSGLAMRSRTETDSGD